MFDSNVSENPKVYLSQYLTNVQSESKSFRKSALNSINKEVFENPDHANDITASFDVVYTYILKAFSDVSEACREIAIKITSNYIEKLPLNDFYLTYIMPVIVRRIGCPEIVEESEELREAAICLVNQIIKKYAGTPFLVPFFNDFVNILSKTCMDPFSNVKREACEAVIQLSGAIKSDFHMQAESFIKPVLTNFSHQHFRVRAKAIQCVGTIVLNGNAKCFEECITPTAEKLFDENVQVRRQVTLEVSNWMFNLRDRYSYWHRMIPLLLTSLSDAIDSVREEAQTLWNNIGEQYMEENEEELKNKSDFLTDAPSHYPPIARPNLGCRTLVQRNIGKIVPAIAREMDGWQNDARLRSSQLLCWLVLCAEDGCTQHANTIVHVFVRGAKDEDVRIVNEIKHGAMLFAHFIVPETWWPLLKPEVHNWEVVFVLASLLQGSHTNKLRSNYVRDILKLLADPVNCQTKNAKYQRSLVQVAENLLDLLKDNCGKISNELFTILFTVYAMAASNEMQTWAHKNLDKLREQTKCGPHMSDLYERHVNAVLCNITSDAVGWSMASADRCLLEAVVLNAGPAIGEHLHLLAPLLRECLATAAVDAEVRLRMFTSLATMMLSRSNFGMAEQNNLEAFLLVIVQDVIMPNLVWSAGRSAESIRTAATACLCAALQSNNVSSEESSAQEAKNGSGDAQVTKDIELFRSADVLETFLDNILPLLQGLLEDRAPLTRQHALRALRDLALLAARAHSFTPDRLHAVYHVVLKRLDDSNDKVRLFATQAIATLFCCRPDDYNLALYRAHVDTLYSTMLVHLDDPDEIFRKDMLDALLIVSNVHPELLKQKLEANVNVCQNKNGYQLLTDHVTEILTSKSV